MCIRDSTGAIANYPNNDRGYWHADWPYNQTNAAHIPAPYADTCSKLSSLWMLTEFNEETGGTLLLPGSHRVKTNPSGGDLFDREVPHPSELQICAPAGSVMLFDSRLWHRHTSANEVMSAGVDNVGQRLWLDIQYVPWWLDVSSMIPGLADYETRAEGLG